jgi:hypothetical protein
MSVVQLAIDDLTRANASDAEQIDSAALTGQKSRYLIEDFRAKIAVELAIQKQAETDASGELHACRIRMRNYDDTMYGLLEELTVETGGLMQRVLSKNPIRVMQFNESNRRLNNVLGEASDGVGVVVVVVEDKASLVDLKTGLVLDVLVGDPKAAEKTVYARHEDAVHNANHAHHVRTHNAEIFGHSARISCVHFNGPRLLTGGFDCNVCIWDVDRKGEQKGCFAAVLLREGEYTSHEGSVYLLLIL